MMTNLLFEITTYDTPYNLQIKTESEIKKLFILSLNSIGVTFKHIFSFSTSRRITIYIIDIVTIIKSKTIIKKGPPSNSSSEVIKKFLLSNSITLKNCYRESTPKGEFYFAQIHTKEVLLKVILPNFIIKEILSKITFKSSMFWNESKIKWSRPIINLILCLGKDFIKFNFAGVNSSNKVKGHMFLSSEDKIINKPEDYFNILTSLKVVLLTYANNVKDISPYLLTNPELGYLTYSREEIILKEINLFAIKHNILPNLDNDLLNDILYLVEYPVVLFGKIPIKYLNLPKELLLCTMVKNQRYINFFNKDNSISAHFAIVSNLTALDNGSTIIEGNQKVLNARLEDGLFFYELDIKENWFNKKYDLKKISFFEDLGNMLDKQERMKKLASLIFPNDGLNKICDFCKIDLTSKVVGEFPELQGTMGYYYAKLSGFTELEALAIKEHYMPLSSNSELPTSILGAKLAFLDKIDTLICFFNIGKVPTSSGDPFALRRATLGVIRICIKYNLDINLTKFLKKDLLEFFVERLIVYLLNVGFDKSIILAVIDKNNFNIKTISYRTLELKKVLDNNENFIGTYKRILNILKSYSKYNPKVGVIEIDKDLLKTKEEHLLFKKILILQGKYFNLHQQIKYDTIPNHLVFNTKELSSNITTEKLYREYISEILLLIPIVDAYLNSELIINYDLPELTSNRVALLTLAIHFFRYIGNLDFLI